MANLGTPCVRNPRTLLVCAVAAAAAGDHDESRRLEHDADALGMEGYPVLLDPPRLRLALLRGELDRVEALLGDPAARHYFWFGLSAQATRLDALAALRDREKIEVEALPLLGSNTYLEPFALRALGIVREDKSLIEQAAGSFDAMKLPWHAAQTRALF